MSGCTKIEIDVVRHRHVETLGETYQAAEHNYTDPDQQGNRGGHFFRTRRGRIAIPERHTAEGKQLEHCHVHTTQQYHQHLVTERRMDRQWRGSGGRG